MSKQVLEALMNSSEKRKKASVKELAVKSATEPLVYWAI